MLEGLGRWLRWTMILAAVGLVAIVVGVVWLLSHVRIGWAS